MKAHILIVFTVLNLSSCTDISKDAIYEIFTKKCYTCDENCTSQEVINCSRDNKCFSKSTNSSETKGCIEPDSINSLCSNANGDVTSCYTCDSSYCNDDTRDGTGVTRCYVCIDECSTPPDQHICDEVLESVQGEPVKAVCLSYEVRTEGQVTESKGCIPDDPVIRQTCVLANLLYEEITCSTCEEDLCNYEYEEEPSVEQCYYCMDNCDVHQEIQNCKEELGEDVISKCGAIDYVLGGERIVARGCLEVTTAIQGTCNLVNLLGGNCTICDTNLCNGGDIPDPENYVDECYYCEGICETLEIQQCENERSKCIATEIAQNGETHISRGCIEVTEEVQTNCDTINQQGGNCTICDTNLCNGVEEIENYVDECYYCERCDGPPEIQQCESDRSKCIATEITQNGVTTVSRGCIEVTDEVQSNCDSINQQGGNCTICDTNLCNGVDEVENYVDECYYCQNTCTPPLEIHQCREILGENARSKCIAIEVVVDGETLVSRACVEVSDELQGTCDSVNQQGGNCTICDTNLCNGMEDQEEDGNGSGSERAVPIIYATVFIIFLIKFA